MSELSVKLIEPIPRSESLGSVDLGDVANVLGK